MSTGEQSCLCRSQVEPLRRVTFRDDMNRSELIVFRPCCWYFADLRGRLPRTRASRTSSSTPARAASSPPTTKNSSPRRSTCPGVTKCVTVRRRKTIRMLYGAVQNLARCVVRCSNLSRCLGGDTVVFAQPPTGRYCLESCYKYNNFNRVFCLWGSLGVFVGCRATTTVIQGRATCALAYRFAHLMTNIVVAK